MKYLIDTNICIYIIKKKPAKVLRHFLKCKPGDISISSVTLAELYYGVSKSSKRDKNLIALQEFLQPLVVLEYSHDDAVIYGKIRTALERKGLPVGAMDMLIAAQALNRDLILVTNNLKEFKRIPGIRLENWG